MENKKYPISEEQINIVSETSVSYDSSIGYEPSIGYLISVSRKGMPFQHFKEITDKSAFKMDEWSHFLHLSERTIQRYKKENKSFDPIYTERILDISLLQNKGIEVFGNKDKFNAWLGIPSIALGNIKPKELMDSAFGINLIKDELIRIEHGIFA